MQIKQIPKFFEIFRYHIKIPFLITPDNIRTVTACVIMQVSSIPIKDFFCTLDIGKHIKITTRILTYNKEIGYRDNIFLEIVIHQ